MQSTLIGEAETEYYDLKTDDYVRMSAPVISLQSRLQSPGASAQSMRDKRVGVMLLLGHRIAILRHLRFVPLRLNIAVQ